MSTNQRSIGMALAPFAVAATMMASASVANAQDSSTIPTNDNVAPVETVERLKTETSFSGFNPRFPFNSEMGMLVGGGAGGLALLFGVYAYRRRVKWALPAMLAGGVVAMTLLNPELTKQDFQELPTTIVVVTDESTSNKLGSRAELTEQIKQKVLADIGSFDNVVIKVVQVEDSFDTGQNNGTRIFNALKNIDGLNPDQVGGVIVLTDGQIHDVPSVSPFGADAPIHTFLTGNDAEKDRSAVLLSAPHFGQVDQEQQIRFRIDDFGVDSTLPSLPIDVQISSGNSEPEIIKAMPGEEVTATVKLKSPGTNIYTITAPELEGELTGQNNKLIVNIEGVREDLSILLISGQINNNVPMLRGFAKSDPNAAVIPFMALRYQSDIDKTPREETQLVSLPLKEIFDDALKKYDLIIFDSYENYRAIPTRYLEGMVKYVEEGGAMLILSGPEYAGRRSLDRSPIGKNLLPVKPNGEVREDIFTPMLSDDGYRHPITRNLSGAGEGDTKPSWGPWIRVVGSDVIAGDDSRTLLQTPEGQPLLVIANREEGRVATLLSDSLHLWDRGFEGGGPSQELLQKVSHWLMRAPELEEEFLRVKQAGNQLVIERQTMSDKEPPAVEIITPDGSTQTVELKTQSAPGVWQAEYTFDQKGAYRFVQTEGDKSYSTSIKVGVDQSLELQEVVASDTPMREFSAGINGYLGYALNGAGELSIPELRFVSATDDSPVMHGDDWVRLTQQDVKSLKGQQNNPLIPGWLSALMVTGLLVWGASRTDGHRKIKGLLGNLGIGRNNKNDGSDLKSNQPSPT